MLSEQQILAHNNRINILNIQKMSTEDRDRAIARGTDAERLLNDQSLALFITGFKFDLVDELTGFSNYTDEINNKRLALTHQLTAMERFVDSLRHAVILKERLVTLQKGSVSPNQ